MNMKKIAILALSLCMIAAIAITGTVAYFTDVDTKDNVFTFGNVDVVLNEEYTQGTNVIPNETKSARTTKKVTVSNYGATDAWVRVHIAYPVYLRDVNGNSYNDVIHTNFSGDSVADGRWSWTPDNKMVGTTYPGWIDNGLENNNIYFTVIDGMEYMVDVVTYKTALGTNETTAEPVITSFYMDKYVDDLVNIADGTVTYYKPNFANSARDKNNVVEGAEWMAFELPRNENFLTTDSQIKVIAEATQISPDFTDAYNALNTAFGVPGVTYSAFADNYSKNAQSDYTYTTEELKALAGVAQLDATGYPQTAAN